MHTFEAIAFVKIDKGQIEESLRKGIIEVLRYVEKIEKPISLESLVFGYDRAFFWAVMLVLGAALMGALIIKEKRRTPGKQEQVQAHGI